MNSDAVIRKATQNDVDRIYNIIRHYSRKSILLGRSRKDIKLSLRCFYVAEIEQTVVGTISYYEYGSHLNEIRSLSVDKSYLRRGIGSALLKKVIQDLCALDNPKIFVLTYTPKFFEENGFSVIPKESLPEKIWKDCMTCKNIDSCDETALVYNSPVA